MDLKKILRKSLRRLKITPNHRQKIRNLLRSKRKKNKLLLRRKIKELPLIN